MKRLLIAGFVGLTILSACDKKEDAGPTITENRTIPEFNEVRLDGSQELRINSENEFDLRVTAPDNLMPYLETFVTGGKLILREKSNDIDHDRVLIEISENFLNSIQLDGSGRIFAEDTIYSESLEISVDGSGEADIIAKTELLRLDIDGSGRIDARGEASEVRSHISGSGLILSQNIDSSTAEARIEGSGSIDIFATDKLFARIEGSGVIRYWGQPGSVNASVEGSGSIIEIN
ncbi:MAG: head GIN domain-containing protein [Bacteroidota bacterium]